MTTTLAPTFLLIFAMSSAMAQDSGSGDTSDDNGMDIYAIAAIFFMVVLAVLLLFRFASQLVSCDVLLEEKEEAEEAQKKIEMTSANKCTIP